MFDTRAENLDDAWANFELDLPLEPPQFGGMHPFYVDRPGDPSARLTRGLTRRFSQPPKYFFSGHRGCGKSTELRRLARERSIVGKYWPVHFTIRDEGDINNLDFKDVLLAIAGQMYRQYKDYKQDGLPPQLEREIESWRGKIVEEIKRSSRLAAIEFEGGLSAFFGNLGLKMKLEPATRTEVRQIIARDVTGLIQLINTLNTTIFAQEQRWPLILIDDLDKLDLAVAKEIFHDHREAMFQPNCAIIYTFSSSLFFSIEYEAIAGYDVFLPNITLHDFGQLTLNPPGYAAMRSFIHKRMDAQLIAADALDEAVRVSGGVFRELARIMRAAIDRAGSGDQITLPHVRGAAAEIRNEYRRILNQEHRAVLHAVRASKRLDDPNRAAPLLHLLALLQYADDREVWWDLHPALVPYLDEYHHEHIGQHTAGA